MVIAKDTRITDLMTALQGKNVQIAGLEETTELQKSLTIGAQATAEALNTQVEELKKENHKQSLHAQKLVAEVDEKDRRIAALEIEVDEHCATIARLDEGESSARFSSHHSLQTDQDGNTGHSASHKTGDIKTEWQKIDLGPAGQHMQYTVEEASNTMVNPTTSPEASIEKGAGPTVNLSAFPIFATTTTVKQVAAPPPAPKLKMAIDLSKFTKKPATEIFATQKKQVKAASVHSAEDGSVPIIDPTTEIRTKSFEERTLFARGPKVQVKIGDTTLATIPKYVLMQCSHKAFKHFTNNPSSTSLDLPANSMDTAAAAAHLKWMEEMTCQSRVYSITLHSDEKFDDKNLQICRAARVLGLNNMYIGHFTKTFCDRIRSNTASYDFLAKAAASAFPENDPVYDCLAHNLAILRLRGAVKSPAELNAFLEKHTGLRAKVERIGERMRGKRNGESGAKAVRGRKNVKDAKYGHSGEDKSSEVLKCDG